MQAAAPGLPSPVRPWAASAVGRLTGTRLLERLGQTRTLLYGGTTAALGMLLGPPAIGFITGSSAAR